MLAKQIINIIEHLAPASQQEQWDNSGIQIGDTNQNVNTILLCVDASENVIDEAIEKHCDMIISHHPLLFHTPKTITPVSCFGRTIIKAIKHNITIYSSHTSIDKYINGVSGIMATKMGIRNYTILCPTEQSNVGLGVIGNLKQEMPATRFLGHVKKIFNAPVIRYSGNISNTIIRKVALCGGAGAEFIDMAINSNADAYITADMKYHEMQKNAEKILLVDVDHWVSEHFVVDVFADMLTQQTNLNIIKSEKDKSPIEII